MEEANSEAPTKITKLFSSAICIICYLPNTDEPCNIYMDIRTVGMNKKVTVYVHVACFFFPERSFLQNGHFSFVSTAMETEHKGSKNEMLTCYLDLLVLRKRPSLLCTTSRRWWSLISRPSLQMQRKQNKTKRKDNRTEVGHCQNAVPQSMIKDRTTIIR